MYKFIYFVIFFISIFNANAKDCIISNNSQNAVIKLIANYISEQTNREKIELYDYSDLNRQHSYCIYKMVINRKKNSVKIYNFDGNFDWLVNARFDFALNLPTLKESVKKGEMIKESDLKFTTVNAKEVIHQQYLLDKKDIIGKVARVNLQSENYIKKKQLTEAVMVKKKSVIDLLYHTQNVKISMNAIALEDGKKDDIIQILNPRSKNNLQGRVVDYNLVKIIN